MVIKMKLKQESQHIVHKNPPNHREAVGKMLLIIVDSQQPTIKSVTMLRKATSYQYNYKPINLSTLFTNPVAVGNYRIL